MSDLMSERATFRRMDEATKHDWDVVMAHMYSDVETAVADRALEELRKLGGDHGGMAVNRLTHSLQTAHLAEADGKDEEYVVCALLHDMGDFLAPWNHADIAAAVLKPYVSEANHWMVANHGTVQGYYFFHHIGLDRNARDTISDHEHYPRTEEFCAKYDQVAFDPDVVTPPLSHFEDSVYRVLGTRSS